MKMKKTKILGLVLALIMFFTNLPFGSGIVHAEGEDDVTIEFKNFPDAKFREYIKDKIDKDGNGSLSKAEREDVKKIDVSFSGSGTKYKNLIGLKYFPNLEELNCKENDISDLNLSENLKLTYLDCTYNYLNSELDLSKNIELKTLICRNMKLENLNLENNTKLEKLDFTNNRVKNIDLSKNTNLIELICENNNLESLDLINNTKLKILNFKLNGLKNIDLSKNLELEDLNCSQNWSLGKLDLSSNKNLTKLNCFFCGLTDLKLAENNSIKDLNCEKNNLKELDLSKSPNLTVLKCSVNELEKLDLSNNSNIDYLNCSENKLTSLDLSTHSKTINFSGTGQNYTVTLVPGAEYITANDLPQGLDFTKIITPITFASIDNNRFKLEPNADYIEYEYNVGNNVARKLGVKIKIGHYTKMTVLTEPQLEYTEGDKLDLSKLVVALEDSEGKKLQVPYDKFQHYGIITNYANEIELKINEHNGRKIKISLESLKAETKNVLNVKEREFDPNNVVEIEVKTQPTKLEYIEGDSLVLDGLVVTLKDNFGKTQDVPLSNFDAYEITTNPKNGAKLALDNNATAITVKKGDLDPAVTNTITVTAKAFDPDHVTKIEVKTQPTKLEYTEGDSLVLDGLEVTLTDDFGKTKNVNFVDFAQYDITAEPKNGTALTVAAHNGKPVTLTKGNLESAKTENLTVNARVFDPDNVESIKVTKEPDKIIYTEGDNLDLTGLVVTLTDNQGTTKEVPFANFETYDLVATPANKTELTVTDNGQPVEITKGDLSAETAALTVNSKGFDLDNVKTIEVISQPSILIYTEGEKLDLAGLKVKLIDNNNKFKEVSFEDFDENGITTNPANKKELTVADNEKAVKISKGDASINTNPLTVNPKVFDSQNIAKIEVKTQPKLDYTEDDKLNLSELVVTLTDNHGLKEDVAFENFAQYGLTATPSNNTTLAVSDDGKKIIITKDNLPPAETNALTVKAKENPPTPTDPKIIGPVDPNAPGTTVPNPNEYWTVTFVSEDTNKGTVDAANTFYIPMTENKKLSDLKAPAVKANPGFEFVKWDTALNTNIDKNLTVKAIFKAKGNTPNPPKPQDPDQEARDYWIIRFLSDNPYRGYIGYSDTVRIEKNRGYRIEDLARFAPEAIPYSGYEFAGWSPYLYGNQAFINDDMDIYARFEEIYVPRYSYERRRPRRIDDDRDDRDDSKEEKPVEVNEYDKLEAILFINDSIMQKSVNGVVSQVRMDIVPFIYQARTMLPIRYVAESLGFMVTWDANTRTVYLVDKENIVQIPVDTNNIIVNGKTFVSDVKPMIKNNRTMLPVANVARALGLQDGKDILWDAAMKFVTLRRNVLK